MKFKVAELEFHEGSNTIWIHSLDGSTMLRIKCTGKIVIDQRCVSPVPHSDIMVLGNISFCVPADGSNHGE